MHKTNIWDVLRGVFARVNIRPGVAHPHTFAHTAIQAMWSQVVPFEVIRQFVGHTSMATTIGVHGKIRKEDIMAIIATKIPGLDLAGEKEDMQQRWALVFARLRCPWEFPEEEGTPRPPTDAAVRRSITSPGRLV